MDVWHSIYLQILEARCKNSNLRLEAVLEARGGHVVSKHLFLNKNPQRILEIWKDFIKSLRTASVHSNGIHAKPFRSLSINVEFDHLC